LTIADIAIFVWAITAIWCGIEIDEFPAVKKWRDGIHQRMAVKKGLKVPVTYPFSDDLVLDPKRKRFYDMIEREGKKIIQKEAQELAKRYEKL